MQTYPTDAQSALLFCWRCAYSRISDEYIKHSQGVDKRAFWIYVVLALIGLVISCYPIAVLNGMLPKSGKVIMAGSLLISGALTIWALLRILAMPLVQMKLFADTDNKAWLKEFGKLDKQGVDFDTLNRAIQLK